MDPYVSHTAGGEQAWSCGRKVNFSGWSEISLPARRWRRRLIPDSSHSSSIKTPESPVIFSWEQLSLIPWKFSSRQTESSPLPRDIPVTWLIWRREQLAVPAGLEPSVTSVSVFQLTPSRAPVPEILLCAGTLSHRIVSVTHLVPSPLPSINSSPSLPFSRIHTHPLRFTLANPVYMRVPECGYGDRHCSL